ncbi:tetratricopeptide repeat protein [Actinoplanes missouriensis]|uniref:CHAT domain-containing tetratricopeptide repeat protein n=1 Tax=Actinoplanes missouriensis TaxID=1866 RepID=UPI00340986B3
MTDRLLVDLGADDRVTVSVLEDAAGGLPESGEPFPLLWSMNADDAEELRWYLEDYLRAPYGVYQQRGEQVAARLDEWGRAAFGAVFDGSRAARDAYVRLRDRGVPLEVVVRSAVAERLGLPWELLHDPARPAPLVLDGVRVRRALPTADLAGTFRVAGERLRVLMVISRPAGEDDVGYRMVARPLLARLEAVRGEVDLVVLRPPTLDRLREVLAEARAAGTPFQVVHFDGHGAFDGVPRPAWGPLVTLESSAGQGVLVFEQPGGGPDRVPAGRVAAVLSEAEVPVVVLNACQSGALGGDVGAAVATRLLQQGAAAVVAMAFSVYAVAAAEFMTAFYDRLFGGGEVADAVAAGRLRLAERNKRPSPKGPLPLQDWLVPVLYARQDVSFPGLRREPTAGPSLDAILDDVRQRPARGDLNDPLAPVGEFVGRDGLFYELETAARLQKIVLLHGGGGSGKTELAKAFGRWWRDTGGVEQPELVIWHSFEPGVASFVLPGVLNAIGNRVWGTAFAQLDDDEQRLQSVLKLLREHRLLLIWDNFESVYSMPDPTGATPPLDESGRTQITRFLADASRGKSAILVTSRSTEDWLGDLRRIEVVGLGREEADEYADAILAPYPRAATRRKDPAFAQLMTWLRGHPLSMRLVLTHLDATDAATILADLHDTGGSLLGPEEAGRTESLAASIAYSYRHLTVEEQQVLVVLSLFHGTTDADVLGRLSTDNVPPQFVGHNAENWKIMLDRAAGLGMLTAIGGNMYATHPALPAFLTARWQHQQGDSYIDQREATERALVNAYSSLSVWLDKQLIGGRAEFAIALIHFQRHTLGAMLGHSLTLPDHTAALSIAIVLMRYWDMLGLRSEADGWTDRILHATESTDGSPPPLSTPSGNLWLYTLGEEAGRQISAQQLDAAERTYHRLLKLILTQPDGSSLDEILAGIYHQLGGVAHIRGDLETAENWYRRSLSINKKAGARRDTSAGYFQMGRIAEERGDFGAAENWYQQSLAIDKEIGDRNSMSSAYHQLGTTAQRRGDLETAENWYQQSLTIKAALGNRPGMAKAYHQLGMIAQHRGDLETAENWYQRSLTIEEELGNRPGMATGYHQIGIVAHLRGDLATAEHWYRQALARKQELDNPASIALTYGQLGLLAEDRGDSTLAVTQMIRGITLFETFPHPLTEGLSVQLARLTAVSGWSVLRAGWLEVTGQEVPPAVIDYIQAIQREGVPE